MISWSSGKSDPIVEIFFHFFSSSLDARDDCASDHNSKIFVLDKRSWSGFAKIYISNFGTYAMRFDRDERRIPRQIKFHGTQKICFISRKKDILPFLFINIPFIRFLSIQHVVSVRSRFNEKRSLNISWVNRSFFWPAFFSSSVQHQIGQ